ncbi:MAG: undecaprenyldiphospho-muramoylpentapeptide beta-N-acetylglucosaminyltransferase [Bryobacteraceae bacterium]
MSLFVMTGGGTGGHVLPLLAVAGELRGRGHDVVFLGTRAGLEARLVPQNGFRLEFLEIGGLKGVGVRRALRTLWQLPASTIRAMLWLRSWRPGAVFSMGGYVAGPPVLAALLLRIPVVAMEPNAVPGITNLRLGQYVQKTLIGFEEAASRFPPGRTEVTGLPVRDEFFAVPARPAGGVFSVLITGGSRGARTLNLAARESWPLFRAAGTKIRIVHQAGADGAADLARDFAQSGLDGEVVAFVEDMPRAFGEADLVVSRSGAGAVFELAAAGKPALLVPFPYAADQHQLRNAEAFARSGAGRVILDRDLNGRKLFEAVSALSADHRQLERMSAAARSMAKRGAARRASELLEQLDKNKV